MYMYIYRYIYIVANCSRTRTEERKYTTRRRKTLEDSVRIASSKQDNVRPRGDFPHKVCPSLFVLRL